MLYVHVTSQMRERLEWFTNTLEIFQNPEHRLEIYKTMWLFSAKLSCRTASQAQLSRTAWQSPDREHCRVQLVAWSRTGEDCFTQSLPSLDLALTNISFQILEKIRCMQQSESEGRGRMLGKMYTHLSNWIYRGLLAKLNLLESKGS